MQVVLFVCLVLYTLILLGVMWVTSRKATNDAFFRGNRKSPWFVVAYGMIGASLSGVTFMSVPGWVDARGFSYMLTVFGFFLGYLVISFILMPTYYKLNLTSIYTYLETRFGFFSHKTGSFFFLVSRTIGASLRMFIVIAVLQKFVFDGWGIPFEITVCIFLALILLFTFRGGIKTIIWTDTLQTTFMLTALIMSFLMVGKALNLDFGGLLAAVWKSGYNTYIYTDPTSRLCWWKQIVGGMFIAVCMTGLDQEMMQKNLSCPNIKSAQKNMITFSLVLFFVNFLFLLLGAALYIYASQNGIDVQGDNLFPTIAIHHLTPVAGVIFIIGLISALYPSADGALTSLTTAFSIDFLNLEQRKDFSERKKEKVRYGVHLGFAVLFVGIVIFYNYHQNKYLIDILYQIASITYGPLLGLFAFGFITKRRVRDRLVPIVCLLAPTICFILNLNSKEWFDYSFDFELLLLNGLLTFLGLLLVSRKGK
ncbi:MAG: sodium:solute symporter [Lentimicrobiaceae bacterium]|nr:sodium:solute symporter [Lentimicrobiaceae bacterium]